MKMTPYVLRRMSRSPVPRRALNLIKNAVISQPWAVEQMPDVEIDDKQDLESRVNIATSVFEHPNNDDSFQTFVEQGLEDLLIFGAEATEARVTPDLERPLKMWKVNVESIRIFPGWREAIADSYPRYAQMTGLKGERGAQLFYDDEMMYIRDNIATDSPFGTGKMEIAFTSVSDFLGVQGMAGRSGTDQIHKTWLWWETPQTESGYQIIRRHIQNELEGQAKVSIVGGMKKPDVLEIQPTTEEDLLLNWQELLIRMIANAFDMSAMALGIEHDVNRSTAAVLDDKDFRSAVFPICMRIQEAYTRKILHQKLGWKDLRFRFLRLDDPNMESMMDLMAKAYSMNAVVPNEVREKMGMEKFDKNLHPYAELTQMEAMLILTEATSRIQEDVQQRATEKQQQQQQLVQKQQQAHEKAILNSPANNPVMGLPPGQGQPGMGGPPFGAKPGLGQMPGTGAPAGPGGGAGGSAYGQPKAPKKIALPKFPIAGSIYTAQQISQMPVKQVKTLVQNGKLPKPKQLLKNMQNQNPSILEEMAEELREYFEKMDKEQDPAPKLSPKRTKELTKEQMKRFKDQDKRPKDFSQFLLKKGMLAPKVKSDLVPPPHSTKRGGTPGNINLLQRG